MGACATIVVVVASPQVVGLSSCFTHRPNTLKLCPLPFNVRLFFTFVFFVYGFWWSLSSHSGLEIFALDCFPFVCGSRDWGFRSKWWSSVMCLGNSLFVCDQRFILLRTLFKQLWMLETALFCVSLCYWLFCGEV